MRLKNVVQQRDKYPASFAAEREQRIAAANRAALLASHSYF